MQGNYGLKYLEDESDTSVVSQKTQMMRIYQGCEASLGSAQTNRTRQQEIYKNR